MKRVAFPVVSLAQLGWMILRSMAACYKSSPGAWRNPQLWQQLIYHDTRCYLSFYQAGRAIGTGKDAFKAVNWLIERSENYNFSNMFSTHRVYSALFLGLTLSTRTIPEKYGKLWGRFMEQIDDFIATLIQANVSCLMCHSHRAVIEDIVLQKLQPRFSTTIGETHFTKIDIATPLLDIVLSQSTKRLRCAVEMLGREIGEIDLPVFDGSVSSWVLKDAIANQFAWEILSRFLSHTDCPHFFEMSQKEAWDCFVQTLWGSAQNLSSGQQAGGKANAEDIQTLTSDLKTPKLHVVEVSGALFPLPVSPVAREIIVTVGGAMVGSFTIPAANQPINIESLRQLVTINSGFELCRAAVREGIISQPLDGEGGLRSRLAQATALRKADMKPEVAQSLIGLTYHQSNSLIWGRTLPVAIGSSASRWSALPLEALDIIEGSATATGAPFLANQDRQTPRQVLSGPYINTEARMVAIKHTVDEAAEAPTSDLDTLELLNKVEQRHSCKIDALPLKRLPILMYHRISPSDTSCAQRWQIEPEAFAKQLSYLKREGFYSVRPIEWQRAITTQTPLPGKPVMLTFDDGYLDFYTHAWPILKQYGFTAVVFIIAAKVGQIFEDHALMNWWQIKSLQAEGIEFGSHSMNHLMMPVLSHTEIIREGLRSRTLLEKKLDRAVRTFCYPYSATEPIIQHLIGACGYELGFGGNPSYSHITENPMNLSRIEIAGSDDFQSFADTLQQ